MTWIQIKIKTTAQFAEQMSECLHDLGSVAVTYQDAGDEPLYEPPLNEIVLWKQVLLTALFAESFSIQIAIAALEKLVGHTLDYSIEKVEDQVWEKVWMTNFQAMQFGKRLWILPSYTAVESPSPHHVILDPGLAFGTGTHPTTALCLEWLDESLKPNTTLIDYGCGSGILAIAALKLGASKVWAVDYDNQALLATAENAERNQIEKERLVLLLPENMPAIHADVLMANILANPLIELAENFSKLLKENGIIVLSGILENQITSVCDAYQKYFAIQRIDMKEEWVRIVCCKRTLSG